MRQYETMKQETVKCFKKYGEIKKQPGRSEDDALKAFPQSSNLKGVFKASFDASAKMPSYDCERILRLCQPRAGTMLARYASYLSRNAFEHDFTEELPP